MTRLDEEIAASIGLGGLSYSSLHESSTTLNPKGFGDIREFFRAAMKEKIPFTLKLPDHDLLVHQGNKNEIMKYIEGALAYAESKS